MIHFRTFNRVDSRICFQCGAVAGSCDHLQADPDTITLPVSTPYQRNWHRMAWTPREVETLRNLHAANLSNSQIAEAMNRTEGSIAGQLHRCVRGGA